MSKQGSEKNQTDISRYLDTLWLERGLSENTLMAYRRDLQMTAQWLEKRSQGQMALLQADNDALIEFMVQRKSAGVSDKSSARWLSTLRGFYRYMIFNQRLVDDPTQKLEHPKLGRSLPSSLSPAQVEALLAAPDVTNALGLRDRTMLEVLYASGLRITELVTLELANVNQRQGVVRVIGKGNKERLVPTGENALDWLSRYLRDARLSLLPAGGSVLISKSIGRVMTRQTFWHAIKKYALQAGITEKHLSSYITPCICHTSCG